MTLEEIAVFVARTMRDYKRPHKRIMSAMAWSRPQYIAWCKTNRIVLDAAIRAAAKEQEPIPTPPTQEEYILNRQEIQPLPVGDLSDEAKAELVARSDRELKTGLESIGLSPEEAEEALALQKFNGRHFAKSMDMVSATVLRTTLKMSNQQGCIEARLKEIRERLAAYNDINCPERQKCVEEEAMLMKQYLDAGRLLESIHKTWYDGAARLALVKFRAKHRDEENREKWKPGFRTAIEIDARSQK